jgi:hypothetical protein
MGGDWGDWGHLIFVKQRLRFLPGMLIGILLLLLDLYLMHTLEEEEAGREKIKKRFKVKLYLCVLIVFV